MPLYTTRAPLPQRLIGEFIGFSWEIPLAMFFLVRLISNWHWSDLVAMILSVLAFMAVGLATSFNAASREVRDAFCFLKAFPNMKLERADLSAIVSIDDLRDHGQMSLPLPADANDAARVYIMGCPTPPLPASAKCFPIPGGFSVAFVRDEPLKMTGYALYTLYHELGHALPGATVAQARHTVGPGFALFSAAIVTEAIWPPSMTSVLCLVVWLLLRVLGDLWMASGLQENIADLYALVKLRNRVDTARMLRLRQRALEAWQPSSMPERLTRSVALAGLPRLLKLAERDSIPSLGLARIPNPLLWLISTAIFIYLGFKPGSLPHTLPVVALASITMYSFLDYMRMSRRFAWDMVWLWRALDARAESKGERASMNDEETS